MPKMLFITNSEKETEALGSRLAKVLDPGAVIAMYGGLGMGKTALVRGIAEGLGLDCRVSSPTFTIVNEYSAPGKMELFHFDMYRLSSDEELFGIGWEDYLDRGGICAVEWSENVEDAFDGSEIRVVFRRLDENCREIIIEGVELC